MLLALTVPQVLTLLFLAVIAAWLAELLVGNAPTFGFIGAVVFSLLGVWLFITLPWLELSFEPRLEDIPVVRGLLGGIVVTSLFAYVQKKRRV